MSDLTEALLGGTYTLTHAPIVALRRSCAVAFGAEQRIHRAWVARGASRARPAGSTPVALRAPSALPTGR